MRNDTSNSENEIIEHTSPPVNRASGLSPRAGCDSTPVVTKLKTEVDAMYVSPVSSKLDLRTSDSTTINNRTVVCSLKRKLKYDSCTSENNETGVANQPAKIKKEKERRKNVKRVSKRVRMEKHNSSDSDSDSDSGKDALKLKLLELMSIYAENTNILNQMQLMYTQRMMFRC